jgi:hypothetical protein
MKAQAPEKARMIVSMMMKRKEKEREEETK